MKTDKQQKSIRRWPWMFIILPGSGGLTTIPVQRELYVAFLFGGGLLITCLVFFESFR